MDVADMAQEREQEERQQALAAVVRIDRTAVSNWFCDECGNSIPSARRLAVPGCTRCVECQGLAERGSRA